MALGSSYSNSYGGKSERKAPYWEGAINVPAANEQAAVWRFIRGAYPQTSFDKLSASYVNELNEYYRFVTHRVGGRHGKEFICSAGDLAYDKNSMSQWKPCEGCVTFDSEFQRTDDRNDRIINKTTKYAYTVFDYSGYIEVPIIRKGKAITKRDGTTIMQWERSQIPLESPNLHSYKKQQGRLAPYFASAFAQDTINEWHEKAGLHCASCNGGNTIEVEALCCKNCGQVILDQEAGLPLCKSQNGGPGSTQPRMNQLRAKKIPCQNCGMENIPHEHISCRTCQSAKRATIFDVDTTVHSAQKPGTDISEMRITDVSTPRPPSVNPQQMAKLLPIDFTAILVPEHIEAQQQLIREKMNEKARSQGAVPQQYQQQPQYAPPGAPQQPPPWAAPPQQPPQQYAPPAQAPVYQAPPQYQQPAPAYPPQAAPGAPQFNPQAQYGQYAAPPPPVQQPVYQAPYQAPQAPPQPAPYAPPAGAYPPATPPWMKPQGQ
jgi:hypothetical protein